MDSGDTSQITALVNSDGNFVSSYSDFSTDTENTVLTFGSDDNDITSSQSLSDSSSALNVLQVLMTIPLLLINILMMNQCLILFF